MSERVQIIGSYISPYSSVICQYLEDRYPTPALYPADVADRAQARWLEEYADTRIGEVFIWRLFNQRVINRFVWGEQTDQAVVDRAIEEEIPGILDYLEALAPTQRYLFGDVSIADISIAAFFSQCRVRAIRRRRGALAENGCVDRGGARTRWVRADSSV